MPSEKKAQINALVDRASNIAKELKQEGKLFIDPQGRILIELPDESTTVSLDVFEMDVFEMPEFQQEYQTQYGLSDDQFNQLKLIRGSIIPLQQEYYFHLGLAARTYTRLNPGKFHQEQMNLAHQSTMKRVHELVCEAFKRAFDPNQSIDEIKLIKALDKARKSIAAKAHAIFVEEVVKATGTCLTADELKAMDFKHTAEKTTATPNQLVHVDKSLGLITVIEGSEVTAHDRGPNNIANRQIETFYIDDTLQDPSRLQIRIPSLDVKEGISEKQAVADITRKLETIRGKYNFKKYFTYNLYTALNDGIGDLGGNKQSQGARYIFMGAHEYNHKQNGSSDSFCLVQNISVNGFGDSLGYRGNDLKQEATLMAEMAMVYNLSENIFAGAAELPIITQYKGYLKDRNQGPFFSQSAYAQQAISEIKKQKDEWKKPQNTDTSSQLPIDFAKTALRRMMAYDLHFQHDYSKLIQALSVFIEPVSLGGCKSGNERAQAINGRVAILDSVMRDANNPIVKAINALARAEDSKRVVAQAGALKKALDEQFDKHLHSGVALISCVDQGASTKVKAKRGIERLFNRNYAEESTLDHLYQDNAGTMQAHKGLAKMMKDAWSWPKPMSFWNFLRAQSGGVAGAIGSIIVFPIAVIQAVLYSQYLKGNKGEQEAFRQQLSNTGRYATKPTSDAVAEQAVVISQPDLEDVPTPKKIEDDRVSFAPQNVRIPQGDNQKDMKKQLGGIRLSEKTQNPQNPIKGL